MANITNQAQKNIIIIKINININESNNYYYYFTCPICLKLITNKLNSTILCNHWTSFTLPGTIYHM